MMMDCSMIKSSYPIKRYTILRRMTQLGILALLIAGFKGYTDLLIGDYSFAMLLGVVPLTDPFAVIQMLFAQVPLKTDLLLGAGIVLVLYGLIAGRAFCSWVCPLNMITDAANGLRRVLGIRPNGRFRISRNVRYWAIGISLVLSAIYGLSAFEMISPVGLVQRAMIFGIASGWFTVVALFFFDFAVLQNGFCGHLCPLGGFYSLVTKPAVIRIYHKKEPCSLCMLCKDICPEKQVLAIIGERDGFINFGACTNCARCIEVCPDDALHFSLKGLKKSA